jgi:hypothetical protein
MNVAVWNVNNFSNYPNANIFNYDPAITSHFVDAMLNVQLSNKVGFMWSTLVAGRDTYINDNGRIRNNYSSYFEGRFKAYEANDMMLQLYAGAGFSFLSKQNFYANSGGLVNLGLTLSRKVELMGSVLPVSATAMWNPQAKHGAMQLQIGIF